MNFDLENFSLGEISSIEIEGGKEIRLSEYSDNLKDNSLKYSYEQINKIIEDSKIEKVNLFGIDNDLQAIKEKIEKLYEERIFYLSYWESECVYHGWSWDKDDGRMANAAKITDGITEKFKEIYALILAGMGLKFKKNESGEIDILEDSHE